MKNMITKSVACLVIGLLSLSPTAQARVKPTQIAAAKEVLKPVVNQSQAMSSGKKIALGAGFAVTAAGLLYAADQGLLGEKAQSIVQPVASELKAKASELGKVLYNGINSLFSWQKQDPIEIFRRAKAKPICERAPVCGYVVDNVSRAFSPIKSSLENAKNHYLSEIQKAYDAMLAFNYRNCLAFEEKTLELCLKEGLPKFPGKPPFRVQYDSEYEYQRLANEYFNQVNYYAIDVASGATSFSRMGMLRSLELLRCFVTKS